MSHLQLRRDGDIVIFIELSAKKANEPIFKHIINLLVLFAQNPGGHFLRFGLKTQSQEKISAFPRSLINIPVAKSQEKKEWWCFNSQEPLLKEFGGAESDPVFRTYIKLLIYKLVADTSSN